MKSTSIHTAVAVATLAVLLAAMPAPALVFAPPQEPGGGPNADRGSRMRWPGPYPTAYLGVVDDPAGPPVMVHCMISVELIPVGCWPLEAQTPYAAEFDAALLAAADGKVAVLGAGPQTAELARAAREAAPDVGLLVLVVPDGTGRFLVDVIAALPVRRSSIIRVFRLIDEGGAVRPPLGSAVRRFATLAASGAPAGGWEWEFPSDGQQP